MLLTTPTGDSPEDSSVAQALAAVVAEERARIEMIKKITPAVVCLYPKETMSGGGSGVLIDEDGNGLTNFHVVAPTLAKREAVGGLPDHKKYDVQVLGIDPHGDLAMFHLIRNSATPHVEFGNSDALAVGDPCLALGNPFLLADDYSPTVTFGIISGLHRYQWGTGHALSYTDAIQVDTSINPGNSGGPLFDMSGKLIGINGRVSIEERGRVNVGVGYAITINQIQRFIPALRAGLVTPHAAAGFTVLDAGGSVIVNQIVTDGAAYRAGLRLNDRVQRFGGVEVRSANQFVSLLGTYPAEWPVELIFKHDRATIKSVIRLESLPLPAPRPGPPGQKRFDPFAPTSETRAANRRAVRRAMSLYAKALGGDRPVAEVRLLHFEGVRKASDSPASTGKPVDFVELAGSAADSEAAIRWQLLHAAADPKDFHGKIVRSDEVRGKIAVVIEASLERSAASAPAASSQPTSAGTDDDAASTRLPYRASFCDADGQLLAIEFIDPATRKRRRFEYADEKRTGVLRLPHHRWQFEDDRPIAEDIFDRIEASGG